MAATAAAIADLPIIINSSSIITPRTDVSAVLDIIARTPETELESALSRSGIVPSPSFPEYVLPACLSSPAAAICFFRWSGRLSKPTSQSWHLMVDLLGRNSLFEHMWDAIRSMRLQNVLSSAAFASAFSAYSSAGRLKEALMSFDVMERYGVTPDVSDFNSLISAICASTVLSSADAHTAFDHVKLRLPPDARTFAFLLESFEKDSDAARAKTTFGEMVVRLGWDPKNIRAYDAFLSTLVKVSQAAEALKFLRVMITKGCLPGPKFFNSAIDALAKLNDAINALALWDLMTSFKDREIIPALKTCNSLVSVLCNYSSVDNALRILDEMPFLGVFPDDVTYEAIFECLVRSKRHREAGKFFIEMRKNEMLPSSVNCAAAIQLFFDEFDPDAAMEIWTCVLEERNAEENIECANKLLLGLRDLGRMSDMRKFAEEIIDRGIYIRSSTMDKLKTAFYKAGKPETYDRITRKLKRT